MTANRDAFVHLDSLQGISPLVQSYLASSNQEAMETYETLSPLAQRAVSQFADRMLAQVKDKDVTKIGQMLDSLMQTLDRVDPAALEPKKPSFFKKMFGKTSPSIKQTLTEFERISIQVERIGVQLERAQLQLLKDVELLEQLYAHNRGFFEELATAIAAGLLKKQQAIEVELPTKIDIVQTTKQPLAVQQLNDFTAQLERLDQRIYDLQVSQQVALQTAPQIRMIQQANQTLAEKIEFSIVTLIPLWKNQLAMMLSMNMDHHYNQLEERLARTNERFTSPTFEQQVMKFKETQQELKTAIQDVFALHTATEQDRQHLQLDVAGMKKTTKE